MSAASSIWHIPYWDMGLRICLAFLLGGLVGLEREYSNHAAGFRTHILVSMGSATIMLLSMYGFGDFVSEFNVRMDPARLAAQVITGIGFLGAGAIIRTGSNISGLTTAASIWVVAAIGLCVGAGFYFVAVLVTFFVLISLFLLNKWEKLLLRKRQKQTLTIKIEDSPGVLGQIASELKGKGIQVGNLTIEPLQEEEGPLPIIMLRYSLTTKDADAMMQAVNHISLFPMVRSVELTGAAGGREELGGSGTTAAS